MPRAKAILQSDFPYSIGARCINKEWFTLPMPLVWRIFCQHLKFVQHAFNLEIHAFVLMTNHFHLLVSTPDANISEALSYLLGVISRDLTFHGNRINQTFGGRHFKTIIEKDIHFESVYKYIYRNPVKAGLCRKVEDYPYSTLHGLLGQSKLLVPVVEDKLLFENPEQTLQWLNTPVNSEDWDSVRIALRKGTFKLPRIEKNKKESHFENERI